MNQFKKMIALLVLSLATSSSFADDKGFVLEGVSKLTKSCYLIVDDFGYDEALPWANKFYADVRTSVHGVSIRLVSPRGGKKTQMISLDSNGQLTNDLSVSVRGPANEQTLYRAGSYLAKSEAAPGRRVSCVHLQPMTGAK